ncbi:methyltransferase type 11 [Planotetraspora thailandica]|uniref:Methyltransferase type 11 n=1 Tax=Planotetraspora thailandica TaxID=487172 RepID=A0A8J3XY97_9ACTN|nr:class I SAM-dependent methyltransferase [Planotetraspora thailandica]GII57709.1 methyltransferase type 11 [Planotetraspora thailandica]
MTMVSSWRATDLRPWYGRGMEQFHHPRPACVGRNSHLRPTDERRRLTDGLRGAVLEIGAGDGVKFLCYPDTVREISFAETDPFLLKTVQLACGDGRVKPVVGDLTGLPLPDGALDAVVCSLVLCTAPDLARALAELKRVLRPGGELRFYEHVRSGNPLTAAAERLVKPLWPRVSGGCHPGRDTLTAIEAAGFAVEDVSDVSFRAVSHVLGRAVTRR